MSGSLALFAGDFSGDRAAAYALRVLKSRHPELSLFGLGGEQLAALGQEQFADRHELAVLGFAEVAEKFRFFQKLLTRCEQEVHARKPRAVVLVDYPGFNLRLLKRIAPLGIPVIYLIPPQVWAWGNWRVRQLKQCTRLLVMLPFEEKFYRGHGLPVTFVKHYLLDEIPAADLLTSRPVDGPILLLPGSRHGEVRRHLPLLLDTAQLISERTPARFALGAVRGVADYEAAVQGSGLKVEIHYDRTRSAIAESSLVLAASGTVTLECALLGRPTVVIFRTGWINYQIARRLVVVPHISLPNLLAGRELFPEYIQDQATPSALASMVQQWLAEPAIPAGIAAGLHGIVAGLGGSGFGEAAAREIEVGMRA